MMDCTLTEQRRICNFATWRPYVHYTRWNQLCGAAGQLPQSDSNGAVHLPQLYIMNNYVGCTLTQLFIGAHEFIHDAI